MVARNVVSVIGALLMAVRYHATAVLYMHG